jgi:hypothetical protein
MLLRACRAATSKPGEGFIGVISPYASLAFDETQLAAKGYMSHQARHAPAAPIAASAQMA